jgi:HD-GYP domain-containing protein (c-di-GMP phosphodiesterase class II)
MKVSLDEYQKKIHKINELGIALSLEKNPRKLLEMIAREAKELTNADGCSLYIVSEDSKYLNFSIVMNDTLNIYHLAQEEQESTQQSTFSRIPFRDEQGNPNTNLVAVKAALEDQIINISDIYAKNLNFDFSGTKHFDEQTGYLSRSFLTVPMRDHENKVIGVLQLINAKDPITKEIKAFTKSDQHLVRSLGSQAAVSITKTKLLKNLKHLLESFIHILADAIDKKSPYTGEHCRRVPIITKMIVEAVNRDRQGPLSDLCLSNEEVYELYIAALLHDCGKIVTPIHIVDKATKLETVFDRIHLLETRFEVLKRDAEIAFLKKKIRYLEGESTIDLNMEKQDLIKHQKKISEELEQLRKCNKGEEFMPDETMEFIKELSKRKWKLGEKVYALLSEDEVENLCIRKGTLSDKERSIINKHVEMSIEMLEPLPFPKDLMHVPEIAGAHHERMDGKGYPRGLKKEELSIQARILALADVFEALTGKGRPYKQAMPLSRALSILKEMKDTGHIDPDIYDIFIREKVPFRYAKQHLSKDQLDVLEF